MKKFLILLTFLILSSLILIQAEETAEDVVNKEIEIFEQADTTANDAEQLQQAIDDYSPLDETGKVDFSGYDPFKSKAEQRIETINTYVGPITKVLWGAELSLSWIFIFSLIMWLLLMELILLPVSELLSFNFWGSLLFSGIIASLAMQSFGKNLVIWMNSLISQWWIGILTIGSALIIATIYYMFMIYLGRKAKQAKQKSAEDQTEKDRKILHAHAKLSEQEIKS
jgi:hypothetical protein